MNVNEKYEFFVTINAVTTQVFPAIDELAFRFQLQDGEEYYRATIANDLVFVNNPKLGITDYDYLKAIEDSADRCDEIVIEIYSNCTNPTSFVYSGLLTMTKAQWDEDRCSVTIPVTINDEYTCLFANQDEVIDFNSVTPQITAGNFIGTLQTYSALEENGVAKGPTHNPFTELELSLLRYESIDLGTLWRETWVYIREEDGSGAQPPGEGWVLDSGQWVRAVERNFLSQTIDPVTGEEVVEYEVKGREDFEADNGRLLADVVEYIVLQTCPTLNVVSNFLNINPDGTEPANTVYAAANTYLDTLAIWQKSDIKRFGDANNATKLRISWADLYANLKALFNLRFIVDGTTLRIEHLSYFGEVNGLDLTSQKATYLNGTRRYGYDETKLTNVEKFEMMDFVSPSFNGLDIEYNSSCVDPEARAVTIRASLITTDLDFCLDFPDDVDDDGFFLANIALFDGSYYIQKNTVPAFTSLGPQFNGHLAFPNLHAFYYQHGRVFLEGNMNGSLTTFASSIRTKKQATISIKFCCSEFISLEIVELMNSQYGWGKIESATYSTKQESLTIDLIHDG